MNFTQRLRAIQRKNRSLLCVGLDTDPDKLPGSLRGKPDSVFEFNRRIVQATQDLVCAYKVNLAFTETLGEEGWSVLQRTLNCIPDEIITIGDAKRGDIGNSSVMYAKLLLELYRFGATTVSPYMGFDSVAPFLARPDQGAFILAVTSNPGAKDFQYLTVRGRPLYEAVVRTVRTWNTKKNCGLVVGATRPKELKRVRSLAPDLPLLIPGIGAQGGDVKSAIRFGCDHRGELAIINASRSILYASPGDDYADAARAGAITLRDEINRYRREFFRKRL
jgi:orotidine-5'-phosphate decarboxylase